MDFIVVGSGFFGATVAERLAASGGASVLVVERRSHVGGNSYSFVDESTGIECHRYGSHIFHTVHEDVWDYVRRFSDFNTYRHKVWTEYGGKAYPLPISLDTINRFYDLNLKPYEVDAFLQSVRHAPSGRPPANLEEQAINLVGKDLYTVFFRGYTLKQWGRDPKELPPHIITRLPVRHNYNSDYFSAPYQGIPVKGYGELLSSMLRHSNITLLLSTSFKEFEKMIPKDCIIIYTGAIDELFAYKYGVLEWRSLRFEWETLPYQDYQGTSVMNFADEEIPYTRIHEFKHYHPERTFSYTLDKTVICREYPQRWQHGEEPYYPVDDERNRSLMARYEEEAGRHGNLVAGGRLGQYRYWDMDAAIAAALALADRLMTGDVAAPASHGSHSPRIVAE